MLKTVWFTEKKIDEGTTLLLGGFDGLHLGHRQLLRCAKQYPYPVGVMTIFGGKGDGIFTKEERELVFKQAGVDFVFELDFSTIKDLSPTEFLSCLQAELSPKILLCGEDFRFGAGAKGDSATLKGIDGVMAKVLPLLEKDGKKVSAYEIKNCLANGDVSQANALLGGRFFLIGEVIKDRQVGRTLGFPTANIVYPQGKFPLKKGVYETRITVDGKEYKSMTNYGTRPTFKDETLLTESHLDGYNGDLYGKRLQVEFVRYLRGVERFDSAEALTAQLQEDIRRVREDD